MIQPRRVKVTNGKITHAEHPGGVATSPSRSAVGVDAPDGTYLSLEFVVALLREAEGRIQEESTLREIEADVEVRRLVEQIEMLAL